MNILSERRIQTRRRFERPLRRRLGEVPAWEKVFRGQPPGKRDTHLSRGSSSFPAERLNSITCRLPAILKFPPGRTFPQAHGEAAGGTSRISPPASPTPLGVYNKQILQWADRWCSPYIAIPEEGDCLVDNILDLYRLWGVVVLTRGSKWACAPKLFIVQTETYVIYPPGG